MVNGYEKKVVAVDLDGTLNTVNSFSRFVVFVCRAMMRHCRLGIAMQVAGLVVMRKMRIYSHAAVKKKILGLVHDKLTVGELNQFIDELTKYVCHDVKNILNKYKEEGYLLVLTTAAPEIYATIIARREDFDACIATKTIAPAGLQWTENLKNVKLASLKSWLRDNNASLEVVITDHRDDLPLLCFNRLNTNILVNPSAATVREIASQCPKIKFTQLINSKLDKNFEL